MSLIKCPECGKEISDGVSSCPQCGYPLPKKQVKNLIHRILIGLGRGIKGFWQRWQDYYKEKRTKKVEFLAKHSKCPTCKQWVPKEIDLCNNCGRPFTDEKALSKFLQQERFHKERMQKEGKKRKLISEISSVIIVGVFILAFWVFALFVPIRTCPHCFGVGKFIVSCGYCAGKGNQTIWNIIRSAMEKD